MPLMIPQQKIALCLPYRTPFAQIGKGLAQHQSYELGYAVAKKIYEQIEPQALDGIIVGEGFPQQPNPARVISNLLKVPFDKPAITVNNNCVSSLEAVAEAIRRIELKEGNCYLCLGEESLSGMPFIISGARQNKKVNTLEKLKKALHADLPLGVQVRDTLDEGLGDSETSFGMHITAELVAQKIGIDRETSDNFALQSYVRASKATNKQLYQPYLIPMKSGEGSLKIDEAITLRRGLVENPDRLKKAMLLFDNPQFSFDQFIEKYQPENHHHPTVSIFNSCPRSDGASGALITTAAQANELGLPVKAWIDGYQFKGVDPNYMGLGQAEASLALLEQGNLSLAEIDYIEIHEAFAATAIGALTEMSAPTKFDWQKKFTAGNINAFGGSIALGHPFGATGLRLLMNAALQFEQATECKDALITACAHGGIAGAMHLQRPD